MWRVAQCMSDMLNSIVGTEFKLQEAKKKLRTLQNTQVSQEGDLGPPKVAGDSIKMGS